MVVAAGIAVPATPAWADMDVSRYEAASAYNGTDIKSVTALCPDGTKVVGGGADLSGGGFKVHITGMHPDEADNGFEAVAKEHSPHDGPWKIIAHAVCAPEPAGWHIAYEEFGGASSTLYSGTVFCDAGEKVLGVGARVVSADTSKLFLTIVAPTGTGNGTQAAATEMTGGYAGNWNLRIWAVCATTPTGWEQIVGTEGIGVYWAADSCLSPKKLTGAGAHLNTSLGLIFLQEVAAISYVGDDPSVPDTTSAAVGWVGAMPAHEWRLKAYGICVS